MRQPARDEAHEAPDVVRGREVDERAADPRLAEERDDERRPAEHGRDGLARSPVERAKRRRPLGRRTAPDCAHGTVGGRYAGRRTRDRRILRGEARRKETAEERDGESDPQGGEGEALGPAPQACRRERQRKCEAPDDARWMGRYRSR
jgi:hypothetical protein